MKFTDSLFIKQNYKNLDIFVVLTVTEGTLGGRTGM